MNHEVMNLRIKEVYEFTDLIFKMVEKAGLQIVHPNYHFRRTQTQAEQYCNWCREAIASNREHFYINRLSNDAEPPIRMHMGVCLQAYLTETLNKAAKIFDGIVDSRWESMVYPNGRPQRRM
jgi:hypothetical protein